MPIVEKSLYKPHPFLKNPHAQTIFPAIFRQVKDVQYKRETLRTPDKDILELDWSRVGATKLAIISHGLEGSSEQPYAKGMVKRLNQEGWDALAWNFRGCGGRPSKFINSYHSGKTDDLDYILKHTRSDKFYYEQVVLIGFSVGGNITLKYLGERGQNVDSRLTHSVSFSVPLHLESTSDQLAKRENRLYMEWFLWSLRRKIKGKESEMRLFGLDTDNLHRISTFYEFDNRFTAPLNGFKDAIDYWKKSSSLHYLSGVKVPSLVVNALDDPFLTDRCFPFQESKEHPFLFLETPDRGGHVGFFSSQSSYWAEERAVKFILWGE